jgi:hypothetical protein
MLYSGVDLHTRALVIHTLDTEQRCTGTGHSGMPASADGSWEPGDEETCVAA